MKQVVIDIGSNSVRLVIYDGPPRAPMAICNEKSLCGLGRNLWPSGEMAAESVDFALRTLDRFAGILRDHGNPPTQVIATAAVREAKNGKAFAESVEKLGFRIKVIDGAEEARLAALGVISFEPGASGIVGDMGGGSLELVRISDGDAGKAASLNIGPLRLMQRTDNRPDHAPAIIDEELKKIGWLNNTKERALYAVGGAWRAVARIHMRLRSHPLSVLHHYELTAQQAIDICNLIAKQSRASLEEIPGIPKRRLDTLPYAAMVMKAVLLKIRAERLIVSAGGVREGLLYDRLSEKEKSEDPLFATADFFARRLSPTPEVGPATAAMIAPLFENETPAQKRLRIAACMLIDVGAYFHPDLRGVQAFDTVLRGPFVGISHAERVALALTLFSRHEGRRALLPDEQAIGLLKWDDQQRAIRIGLAMRFAGAFAPKIAVPMDGCSLHRTETALVLRAPRKAEGLIEELQMRRLDSLATAFNLPAEVELFD